MNNLKDYKNEGFDIIIAAGQSNAEGCGLGPCVAEYVPSADILYLADQNPVGWSDYWASDRVFIGKLPTALNIDMAAEKVFDEKAGKRGDFSLYFAREYKKNGYLRKGRRVLIVRAAVGATGFSDKQWGMCDILYLRMLEMIDAALSLNAANRLIAFLWHQGESDAKSDITHAAHYKNLSQLLSSVRSRYNAPKLPFIAGGFVDEWERQNRAVCKPIRDAVQAVCKSGYGAFVETADLKSNNQEIGDGDNIHFSRNALRILGERYFEAWKRI